MRPAVSRVQRGCPLGFHRRTMYEKFDRYTDCSVLDRTRKRTARRSILVVRRRRPTFSARSRRQPNTSLTFTRSSSVFDLYFNRELLPCRHNHDTVAVEASFWSRLIRPRPQAKFEKRQICIEQKKKEKCFYFILFHIFVDHVLKYCPGVCVYSIYL